MFEEKRKSPRYDSLNLSYVCEDENGAILHEGMGRTLNVSEGGILLETNFQVDRNNTLLLEIALEDDLINLSGQVIHSQGGEGNTYKTGVCIEKPDATAQAVLNRFIKMFEQADS